MVVISKSVIGTISGKLGNVVIKKRNGKETISVYGSKPAAHPIRKGYTGRAQHPYKCRI